MTSSSDKGRQTRVTLSAGLTRTESRIELEVMADGTNRKHGARPLNTVFLEFGISFPLQL